MKPKHMKNPEKVGAKSSKILLAGYWNRDIYEKALASGFIANGWSVVPFRYSDHLPSTRIGHLQRKAKFGPAINHMNNSLVDTFERESPTAVLFELSDLVLPVTLRRMKEIRPEVTLLLYHNDNPFIGLRNRIKWRHFFKSLAQADITLVYRPANVEDAQRHGTQHVSILPSYYTSYVHRSLPTESHDECSDVVFVGHYANDGRLETVNYLKQNGIDIKVHGPLWEHAAKRHAWLQGGNLREVRGDEYCQFLSSAKIALVFLSKANRDVYTRRCFEITACGTLMMAPRTRQLENMFRDGVEAVYFDSKEDLLEKTRYYLEHNGEREEIAEAGRKRCIAGGNSEIDRARQVIEIIKAKKSLQRKLDWWRGFF